MINGQNIMDDMDDMDELNKQLSIVSLIGLLVADIDVYLIGDESDTKDLDKVFTAEKIRNQLENSSEKLCNVLTDLGYDINKPLK